jgi:hypothetical protein
MSLAMNFYPCVPLTRCLLILHGAGNLQCIPIKHSKPAGTTTTMSASIELTTPPPESAGEQETEAAVLSTNTIVIICIIVFAVVM